MALSAPRDTPRSGPGRKFSYPQKASTTIYNGAFVVLDAGYVKPGTAAASLVAAGVARLPASIASQAGGASDGLYKLDVEEGDFYFDNKSGDEVVAADVGGPCYVSDDHTVCHTSTTKSLAGVVRRIDSNGQILVSVSPTNAL